MTDDVTKALSKRARDALAVLEKGGRFYHTYFFNERTRRREPGGELYDANDVRVPRIGLAALDELRRNHLVVDQGNSVRGWIFAAAAAPQALEASDNDASGEAAAIVASG